MCRPRGGVSFGHAANGQVVAFRRAAGPDDLLGLRPDCGRDLGPGIVYGVFCRGAESVGRAARVAVDFGEIRPHRLHHPRIDAGRGVVVEIDGKCRLHFLYVGLDRISRSPQGSLAPLGQTTVDTEHSRPHEGQKRVLSNSKCSSRSSRTFNRHRRRTTTSGTKTTTSTVPQSQRTSISSYLQAYTIAPMTRTGNKTIEAVTVCETTESRAVLRQSLFVGQPSLHAFVQKLQKSPQQFNHGTVLRFQTCFYTCPSRQTALSCRSATRFQNLPCRRGFPPPDGIRTR